MGKLQTILRIEKNGLGMYAASKDTGLPFCTKESNRHPAPFDDEKFVENSLKMGFGGGFGSGHFFGFSKKSQLKRWLRKSELLWLCANGYVLCEYTVLKNHCILGDSQCVFVKVHAEGCTEHNISEYFYGLSE